MSTTPQSTGTGWRQGPAACGKDQARQVCSLFPSIWGGLTTGTKSGKVAENVEKPLGGTDCWLRCAMNGIHTDIVAGRLHTLYAYRTIMLINFKHHPVVAISLYMQSERELPATPTPFTLLYRNQANHLLHCKSRHCYCPNCKHEEQYNLSRLSFGLLLLSLEPPWAGAGPSHRRH